MHVPVYFRKLGGPKWLEGTTENVSHSGVLFQSPWALSLDTPLELRVLVTAPGKDRGPAEICSRGVVVRVESRDMSETPIALAVSMRDCRILRQTARDDEIEEDTWTPSSQDAQASHRSKSQPAL